MKPLWESNKLRRERSRIHRYITWVNETLGLRLSGFDDLHSWSIQRPDDFWRSCEQFLEVIWQIPYQDVHKHGDRRLGLRGFEWFVGGELNYAENLLAKCRKLNPAVIAFCESSQGSRSIHGRQLWNAVARMQSQLRDLGIAAGDRVVGVVSNSPEAIVAMLATTSLGAVWSSCSPDFGVQGILDRFGQIEPKVMFFVSEYHYLGKRHSCVSTIQHLASALPTVQGLIAIDLHTNSTIIDDRFFYPDWEQLYGQTGSFLQLEFTPCKANDPLFIMFSSGTTGKPKCIIHTVAGTLIQHLKELVIHSDIQAKDRLFFYTTCGWMMWNWMVTSLATGAGLVVYDGAPHFPTADHLWNLIDIAKVTHFGTSPKYLAHCAKEQTQVRSLKRKLKPLRTILTTGSPLLKEQFEWLYTQLNDLHLASISGGTDIISCFMLGNVLKPVFAGEIQGPGLGMAIDSWNATGESIQDTAGELVCLNAFPSMPKGFWKDVTGQAYQNAYFGYFGDRDVWRHGDLININSRTNGITVYGRSDATLNPGGVRIGTSEIYRAVEASPDVLDSIVAALRTNGDESIVLFVKLRKEIHFTLEWVSQLKLTIKQQLSPRHVPSFVFSVLDIPYTKSGKKVELAVAAILNDQPPKGEVSNGECLDEYRQICRDLRQQLTERERT